MCRLTRAAPYQSVDLCRCCGSAQLEEIISFGDTPIADRLVRPEDLTPEYIAPLTLAICADCGLCQILETVEPEVLFGRDYPYYSSVSKGLLRHFASSAHALITERGLTSKSLVVEAASNDGYMLRNFVEAGIPVLGIDPAEGPVQEARGRGVNTVHDFFGAALAEHLAAQGVSADLFLANNVLAHVADTNGFIAGIRTLLKPDGVAVLEFPYLLDLVQGRAFDTIYHQHLLYLSAATARELFARNGLYLNDAERTNVHGGSLRVSVSYSPGQTARLAGLLREEERLGLNTSAFFDDFKSSLKRMRKDVRGALEKARNSGQTVAAYGAAAKATTLLSYFGLTGEDLRYVVDKSSWKQGLEMPGTGIPIRSPDVLSQTPPDWVLILAWNFAREIISENTQFSDAGGRFLVPVPEFREVRLHDAGMSL